MESLTNARLALAGVDLVQGLAVAEVHSRLSVGLRLHDTGQRILAFYLVEMADRGLHQASGHDSAAHYAEGRLGMDQRRARELIAVGRKLLELPAIDGAFCEQRIGWSKLLLLVRVATPEHEEAWLARALALTCKRLALEVKLSKPGRAPRDPSDRKGTPDVRFRVAVSVGALTHNKLDLAKKKLSAERGHAVDDAECLDVLAELFLNLEEDGTVPGRERVPASLYRIVLHEESGAEDDDGGALLVDTELGKIPIDGVEHLRCDAETTHADDEEAAGDHPRDLDPKTPPALRRRVLARDGQSCRCCGSRHRLMVHHIHYRSRRGKTRSRNLITLCVTCHSLVHGDLLVLEGRHARRIRFVDAGGRPLHCPGHGVAPSELLLLRAPRAEEGAKAPRAPSPRPVTLDTLPDVIDGPWWKRHAALLRSRRSQGLELREGTPLPVGPDPTVPASTKPAADFDEAFPVLVGQEALLRRFETTARGRRTRGRSFPHTLFVGPAGTGKTTLARGVARAHGSRLHAVAGPLLEDPHALVRLLAELRDGDMFFVDEIHAVPRQVLETLYEAMAEGQLSLTLHAGPRSRTVRFDLPAFTVLAATTDDGELPSALRSRFGLRECLDYYADEDLAALVTSAARSQGFHLAAGAAKRLAFFARGTPREALRLLDRVLDHAASRELTHVDRALMDLACERLGYDQDGLDPRERRYLTLLRQSPVPVPLARLARMMGSTARSLARHLEPFLFRRGLVRMTPRGRTAVRYPRLLGAQEA